MKKDYESRYNQWIKKIEKGKRVPASKLIRLKCLDCVCYQPKEITQCPIKDCPLYFARMGRNTTGWNDKEYRKT